MSSVAEPSTHAPGAGSRTATRALAAALAVAAVAAFGVSVRGVIGAGFFAVLVVLAAIDLEQRIIPNRIVLPATLATLVAQTVAAPERWPEWVAAGLGAALFLALPLLVVREGLGMGDLKLALLLGAGLGAAVVDALAYAAAASAATGIWLLVRHGRHALGMSIAFGPFLAFGGIVAYFTGAHVL